MVSEGEGESCCLSTWKENGRSKLYDCWSEKRRYKYPLRSRPHLTRGTAALKVRHCRTCQDSKGQDLNSRQSWLWLEDILVGKMSTWLHIKACALYPSL
jgi:hypothetical protein